MCKSDVGNPSPLAYWSKDGKMIGDFGYKEKNLTIDNIAKGEAATYSCKCVSVLACWQSCEHDHADNALFFRQTLNRL